MGGWDDFIGGLNDISKIAVGIVNTTQAPINHLIDAGERVVTHTEDKISDTIDHTTDGLGNLFSNLSMPLMIGGAVVLVILLKK